MIDYDGNLNDVNLKEGRPFWIIRREATRESRAQFDGAHFEWLSAFPSFLSPIEFQRTNSLVLEMIRWRPPNWLWWSQLIANHHLHSHHQVARWSHFWGGWLRQACCPCQSRSQPTMNNWGVENSPTTWCLVFVKIPGGCLMPTLSYHDDIYIYLYKY